MQLSLCSSVSVGEIESDPAQHVTQVRTDRGPSWVICCRASSTAGPRGGGFVGTAVIASDCAPLRLFGQCTGLATGRRPIGLGEDAVAIVGRRLQPDRGAEPAAEAGIDPFKEVGGGIVVLPGVALTDRCKAATSARAPAAGRYLLHQLDRR